MTVPNANNEVQVVLTSATEVIPTTFYFLESDNLEVKNTDQATIPATTTLVEGTNYTVTLPATVGGNGSITMIGGTIGDTVTITRCLAYTQLTDYVENDTFPAETHEKALDRLLMQITKVWSALFGTNRRYLHYPSTEFGTPTVTPSKSDRIAGGNGTLFGWNDVDGSPDVVAKGVLGTSLTLSNSSTLSRPSSSPVNGATQAAINTNFESTWNGTGGVDGNGAYIAKSGTSFIDGNADLNEDITDLDTALQAVYTNFNTWVDNYLRTVDWTLIFNANPTLASVGGGTYVSNFVTLVSGGFNTNQSGTYNVNTITSDIKAVLIQGVGQNTAQNKRAKIDVNSPVNITLCHSWVGIAGDNYDHGTAVIDVRADKNIAWSIAAQNNGQATINILGYWK